MKKENSFSRNHVRAVLLLVVLVLAFIYLFLYDFSRRVDHLMTDMTTEHLADVNDQSQTAVKNELTRVFEEVRYTADFLSETPELTEESRQRVYEQLKEKCGFANIRLVSADGGLYTVEHEELPHSTGGYVEGICRGESGMTACLSIQRNRTGGLRLLCTGKKRRDCRRRNCRDHDRGADGGYGNHQRI